MYELTGQVSPTGKKVIVHTLPTGNVKFSEVLRDCGQCKGCRLRRRMDTAIRLQHEASLHRDSMFLTLTYEDDSLPVGGSLRHDDMSKFVRLLRLVLKRSGQDVSIRYFGVGEYGGEIGRPHYHLILFGWWPKDAELIYTKREFSKYASREFQQMFLDTGIRYFSSPLIDRVWKKGIANFSATSPATMQYVAKYHVDKVTGDRAEDHYSVAMGDDVFIMRESEQARMSLKPGIGSGWIEKFWRDVYPRSFLVSSDGTKFAPPKYYDSWLESNQPELFESVKAARESVVHPFDKLRDLEPFEINRLGQLAAGRSIGKGPYHGSDIGVSAAELSRSAFRP
jgi:hypothetical protein